MWVKGVRSLVAVTRALALVCAAGCSTQRPRPALAESPGSPDLSGMAALTRPVLLLGDNQIQYLGVGPIFNRSYAADRVAASAIRPPQLDIFGQQLLLDACQTMPDAPILHLGDATNTSCRQELERLFVLVDACPSRRFVIAPGNHDGFLMGSLDSSCSTENPWTLACGRGRELTKPCFVQEVLARIWGIGRGRLGDACRSPATLPPTDSQETASARGSGWLRRVAWHLDLEERWRSYIVQQVDLPAPSGPSSVTAIVIDTNNPDARPSLLPEERHLGSYGGVGKDQRAIIESWVTDSIEASRTKVVLVGHHPIERLTEPSSSFLLDLARRPEVLLYVSGHTHAGRRSYYAVDGRSLPLFELNLGSILDYPNEYRSLELFADARSVAAVAPANLGRQRPACRPEWLPSLSEIGRYREGPFYSSSATSLTWHCLQARAWLLFFEQVPCPACDGSGIAGKLRAALSPRCMESRRQAVLAASQEAEELVWGPPGSRASSRLRLSADQLEYVRCVAYRAAEHELMLGRPIERWEACATPLDPWRMADPFSRGGPSQFLLSSF